MKPLWMLFFLWCCYEDVVVSVLFRGQMAEDGKMDKEFRNLENLVTRKRTPRNVHSQITLNCTSSIVSCKGRCMDERDAGTQKLPRCSCDPYCDYFKDCCADYVQYCQQRSSIKVPAEQWTCRSGIWMIASCPPSWTNQDINQSCISTSPMTADNYKDVLPVVTADNKTYANRFCAQCHGHPQHQLKYYELNSQCVVTPPSKYSKKQMIKFLFDFCGTPSKAPGQDMQRRYCHTPVESCNSHSVSRHVKDMCLFGNYGLVYNTLTRLTFKNFYCGKCFGLSNRLKCGPREGFIVQGNIQGQPFSLVMDIGEASSNEEKTQILSCPKGEVYDIYLESCRKGIQFAPVKSSLMKYHVALWIKAIGRGFPPFTFLFSGREFVESYTRTTRINSTAMTSVTFTLLSPYGHMYLVEFNVDVTDNKVDLSTIMLNNIGIQANAGLNTLSTIGLMIGNYFFTIIKATAKPLTCFETNTFPPSDYQVVPGSEASVYINATGEVLGARDYFPTNLTIINGQQIPVGQIVVCRQLPAANCSGMFIFLQKYEFTIFLNRSVLYKASGRLYEHGTYTWKNSTIMICTNFTESYEQRSQPMTDNHKALTILTYIGFCISVACFLFVLVTYSIFADLRTIPGIILMNLCSALLVAQILWLVGSGLTFTHLGCMVIAIVLHYSFLASFGWMSIIAFNTWKAFSGQARTRNYRTEKRQKRNRIARTMAVGWLPLMMYVSICVALDRSGTVAIGYGGEKGCWINNPRANLFFFAIPVGLSVLWNAVFFVLTVKEIKKAMNQSQMAASQHGARQDSAVYARIAVLMGFTWVFGFVAPFTSYYLMYPFVVLNTLQGLYIAVAFGFTRRVRSFFKSKTNSIDSKSSVCRERSTSNVQTNVENTKL